VSGARARLALLIALALGGCGGAQTTAHGGAGAEPGGAVGAVDTTLPADAPVYATGRVAQIAPLFGVLLALLESEQSADIVRRLALDPVRASSAALYPSEAPLDAAARSIAAAVPASRDAEPASDLEASIARAIAPARDVPLHARAVIASTRPASTFDVLGTFLTGMSLTKWPRTPAGIDGVYATDDEHIVIALLHDDQNVVVELLDFPFAAAGPGQHERARAELERIRGGSRRSTTTPPALADGELGRLVVLPRAAATLHLLTGVGVTLRAIASVDPSARAALLQAGLFEAGGALALTGDARGAYAERIEVAARGSLATVDTTTRITLGPALAGAIAPSAPAQGTTISPMEFGYIEASAAARAVALPHRASEADTPAAFMHLLNEAGGTLPYLYAMPHVIVLLLRELLDEDPELPIPPPIRASADRVGAMFGDHHRVRYALLPPATTAVEAALALPHATGTPRPRMLSLGQPMTIGNTTAVATAVGDRFAVVVSDSPEMLRAAHLELTPASTAVARATLSLVSFSPMFGLSGLGLPPTYHFTLDATATEWILHGTPGAASP